MSAAVVEFLVTGDEVMRGLIADTNTQITATRLYPLGLALRRTIVVGDRGEDIRRALLEISVRADYCIVSGGLGPTADDLTAACAAQAAGVPLRTHEPWLEHLRQRWAKIRPNETMPANNLRQAEVPASAEVLGNPDGSAPAFALRIDRCQFFFLPGVPREYHRIVEEMVLPRLVAANPPLAGGGGAERNAVPLYDFPAWRITNHRLLTMPIRTSALRTLGAFANIFAIESMLDELATERGEDPVAFRLRHLADPRARAVVEAAARRANWGAWRKREGAGHGIGWRNVAWTT